MKTLDRLVYTPLDYSPIEIRRESFLSWYDERSQRVTKFPRVRNPWNYVFFYHNGEWAPGLLDTIMDLKEALEQLPFKKITYVGNFEQRPDSKVRPHTDSQDVEYGNTVKDVTSSDRPEMYGYRLWLVNDQLNDSFYFQLPNNENVIHPEWPEPAIGSWWNFAALNRNVLHGSNGLLPGTRKIIMIVNGELDIEKHNTETLRNAEKFKDKAIWMDDERFGLK